MTAPVTLGAGYFDAMYRDAADPWGFEDRWYEQRKYAISLALLPAGRYGRAFEPGCSIGVLTHLLAQRCGTLLSCDVAAAAVQAAARRTRDLPQVLLEQREIPGQWPQGRFDLIVFSEILYYFGDDDLEQVLNHAVAALEPDGTLLAVHWRHQRRAAALAAAPAQIRQPGLGCRPGHRQRRRLGRTPAAPAGRVRGPV